LSSLGVPRLAGHRGPICDRFGSDSSDWALARALQEQGAWRIVDQDKRAIWLERK